MPVTFAVLLVAAFAAAIVWWLSLSSAGPDPIDPEAEERWLVRWLVQHPRIGGSARSIDQRVSGGLMLVLGLCIVLLGALGVGGLFDMVDHDRGIARADRAVAEWGSRHSSEFTTRLLDHVTDLGDTRVVVTIAAVIAVIDFVRRRNPNVPLFLVVVLAGVGLINNALKMIVDRSRPDVVHLVGSSGSSFPSGHSATAAAAWCALALVLARHWPRRARAIAAGAAALVTFAVAASRALLGVHWLTDVIAGVIVGWAWFSLCALVFGGRMQRLGDPAVRVRALGTSRALDSGIARSQSTTMGL